MSSGGNQSASRAVDDHPAVDKVARAGLIAFGVVHLVMGWMAVQLAFGDSEGKTDSSGAVRQLAQQPYGEVLVWAVAVGMALLVVWQLIEATVGHREFHGMKKLRKRATSLVKAVVYGAIAFTAFQVATGSGGSKKDGTDSMSSRLMDLPWGQAIVGLVALGVAAVGVYLILKGLTRRFLEDIGPDGTRGHSGTAYTALGVIGYVAKGASILGVGGLFGYAAINHEPKKSGGIDAALRTLLDQPFGPVLTAAVGAGFICFGLFCFAWARHINR